MSANSRRRVNLILATSLALLLLKAPWVSAFIFESQLEAQSNGNDHVILLKLPHSISNQEARGQPISQHLPAQAQLQIKAQVQAEKLSQFQHQQPQLQFNLSPQLQAQLRAQLQAQLSDQLDAQFQQSQGNRASNKDLISAAQNPEIVSLVSIPNDSEQYYKRAREQEIEEQSALGNGQQKQEPVQPQSRLVFGPTPAQLSSSDKPIRTNNALHYHVDSPLFEFLNPSELSIISEKSIKDSLMNSASQTQNRQQYSIESGPTQHAQSNQAQVQAQAQVQSSMRPVSQPQRHETQQQQQPQKQLWQSDHSPSVVNGPNVGRIESAMSDAITRANRSEQVVPEMSSGISSFLNRLSYASPEILMRIRDLLRQAATQAKNLTSEEGRESNAYPKSMHIESLLGGRDAATDANRIGQDQMPASQTNPTTLDTISTSHSNLTSHDEVKIPLVVIAMPRLLSFRRNQIASNQLAPANMTASATAATSLPGNYSLQATTSYPANHNTQSRYSPLTQLLMNSTTNSVQPYIQESSANNSQHHQHQQQQHHHQQQQQQQQQHQHQQHQQQTNSAHIADSVPQYTMAPYARHFGLASALPLLQHIALGHQYQAQPNHLTQTGGHLRPDTMLGGRQIPNVRQQFNPYSIQIVARVNDTAESTSSSNVNNNQYTTNQMRVQLDDYQPHHSMGSAQSPSQMQMAHSLRPHSAYELQIQQPDHRERAASLPEYTTKELHPLLFSPVKPMSHNEPPIYRASWPQGTIFLQLPSNDSRLANLTNWDNPKGTSNPRLQIRLANEEANPAITRKAPFSAQNIKPIESEILKLRPLFEVDSKLSSYNNAKEQSLGRKLNTNQLLTLLGHSAEQRSPTNIRRGDQSMYSPLNQQLAGPEVKNAAKMVLMIV